MEKISINTEYIKLDQFLKYVGAVENGSEAKSHILNGLVKVNNEVETRRGRKLYKEYIIDFNGEIYKIV